jgi:hypothetical protein
MISFGSYSEMNWKIDYLTNLFQKGKTSYEQVMDGYYPIHWTKSDTFGSLKRIRSLPLQWYVERK